jgi:signal transduction histidine kinase
VVTGCAVLGLELDEPHRRRTLASIRSAVEHMNRLVEDLLDVTRIEQGHLMLEREPVQLSTLVAEIVSLHRPVAEHRGIRLTPVAAAEGAEVVGDRRRLGQAISNLVDNAIKFTGGGGEVRVTVSQHEASARVAVKDAGPGVSSDHLPHLFNRFWRGVGDTTGGMGLGLAIAKGIAEAHAGAIEVSSGTGDGAEFTLVVPLAERRKHASSRGGRSPSVRSGPPTGREQ